MIDGGDQQLGLRWKVVEQGTARGIGTTLDLERGRAREPDLDQALDGGVEERATSSVTSLLLRSRSTDRLWHHVDLYLPENSQSRLFVSIGGTEARAATERNQVDWFGVASSVLRLIARLTGLLSRAEVAAIVSTVIVVAGIWIWERRRAGIVTPGKAS
ncbi:MAG: hypothetical protein ABI591_14990 [Kofleriaceae bacterium]